MQLAPLRLFFESHLRPGLLGKVRGDAELRFARKLSVDTYRCKRIRVLQAFAKRADRMRAWALGLPMPRREL